MATHSKTPTSQLSTSNPGAQPGNANAQRHGIYSTHYTDAEITRIIESAFSGELTLIDEIGLTRVVLDRCLARHQDADPDQFSNYAKILLEGAGRVGNLMRQQKVLSGEAADSLLDSIASAIEQARDLLGAT
jgi:hypothetical protein